MAVIPPVPSPPEPEPELFPPDSAAGAELVADVGPAPVFLVCELVRVTTIIVFCVLPLASVLVETVVTRVTTRVVGGSDDAISVEVVTDVELPWTVVVVSDGVEDVMGVDGFATVEETGLATVLETTEEETGATLLELALMVAVSWRRSHDGGMIRRQQKEETGVHVLAGEVELDMVWEGKGSR